jgi:copper resistance protein B
MSAMFDLRASRVRFLVGVAFGAFGASIHAQPSADDPTQDHPHSHVRTHDAMQTNATRDVVDNGAASEVVATHVPPPPPQNPMAAMTAAQMANVMEMDDAAPIAAFKFDRLERIGSDNGSATAWKWSASAGGDFDKIVLRSEGEYAEGAFERSDAEALWSHAIAPYWDAQLGARHDFGDSTARNWAAFGVQGLAPYWLEIGATAYIGNSGRTALRVEIDYDLSLTQRLILQPRAEINAYGQGDPSARIGSGLSDAELGLRLRYELRRELAPYVGVERVQRFGGTASLFDAAGVDARETRWVAGVRVWY